MSDKFLFKINTPTIHQSTLSSSQKRNAISQSLSVFSNKMKYKYPSLKQVNCCFDRGTKLFNYKSPSDRYIKLSHYTLMINQSSSNHCKYKRLPPLFHLLPKDSSIYNAKSPRIRFQSHLKQRNSDEEAEGNNPLSNIKSKLMSNSTKAFKVKNIKAQLLSVNPLNEKLNRLRNFWITNDEDKERKTRYTPKFSCIYSKKNGKLLNYKALFSIKKVRKMTSQKVK